MGEVFKFNHYASAMEFWDGRVDSTEDYEAFRWHQWVQPLDLNEDLPDGHFDGGFAFIGFCSEQGVKRNRGRVGTALAPDFIRKQMSNLPCTFDPKVKMYDAGNIICDEISMEEGQALLGKATEKLLNLGLFPIVLGGGHETTYGHFQGQMAHLKKVERPLDMGIINFDAHFDLRPYENGASSGSMFRQIADVMKGEQVPFRYMPLGIQKHSNTVSLFRYAKENDVNYILAKDMQNSSYESILEKIDTFLYHCDSAYITICTDVFSAAYAPGVSATQALGLDPEAVTPIIKHILRTRKVKGFDICEISPRFDQDDTTAKLGAVIIFTVVTTMCKLHDLLMIDFD
ncbi:MAG: formimidoylglutamase [Firmicutes bacterium]|nr:formimidoylglutamase [Bacillota bacterium]